MNLLVELYLNIDNILEGDYLTLKAIRQVDIIERDKATIYLLKELSLKLRHRGWRSLNSIAHQSILAKRVEDLQSVQGGRQHEFTLWVQCLFDEVLVTFNILGIEEINMTAL